MQADRILQKALKDANFQEALGVVYNCLEDANAHSENRDLEREFGQADYGYFTKASEVATSVRWDIIQILYLLTDALDDTGFDELADWCDDTARTYGDMPNPFI